MFASISGDSTEGEIEGTAIYLEVQTVPEPVQVHFLTWPAKSELSRKCKVEMKCLIETQSRNS